jgi:hypothetical protein
MENISLFHSFFIAIIQKKLPQADFTDEIAKTGQRAVYG